MQTKPTRFLPALAAVALLSQPLAAEASTHFNVSLDLGSVFWAMSSCSRQTYVSTQVAYPVVYAPQPVVYAPPPVVYAPPPPPVVYYAPQPVVYAPPPPPVVYYAPPPIVYAPPPAVYYAPPQVVYQPAPVVYVQPRPMYHHGPHYRGPHGGYRGHH